MTPRANDTLGFPPPLLGAAPVRLAVLAGGEGLLSLEKPAGVVWERGRHDGTPGVCEAVRVRLQDGGPEWTALGLREPLSVWPLETETIGVGLLAERGPLHERWRNAFGSGLLEFSYELLAADTLADDATACALPVAEHSQEPRALISHVSGKKSATAFRRLERMGRWSWWEARTCFPRWHQVRLHAAEAGLRIVGESLYADGGILTLAQLMPRRRLNKGGDRPLHEGLCLRLSAVDCRRSGLAAVPVLTAPVPEKWGVLRKRLAAGGK